MDVKPRPGTPVLQWIGVKVATGWRGEGGSHCEGEPLAEAGLSAARDIMVRALVDRVTVVTICIRLVVRRFEVTVEGRRRRIALRKRWYTRVRGLVRGIRTGRGGVILGRKQIFRGTNRLGQRARGVAGRTLLNIRAL